MEPTEHLLCRRFTTRTLTGVVALLLTALTSRAPAGVEHSSSLREEALSSIAPVVRKEIAAGNIPGAVVLIGSHGKIVYRRAFGYRALQPEKLPMTMDTIFDLASLTKVIATTTAVLQLVEAGKLRLEDPVSMYWPEFAVYGKAAITVHDLLTHYSGLRAGLDLRSPWSGYATALKLIAAEKPAALRGSRFIYSDINFAVLGELVQRVSGLPLDQYCAQHIFAPLGMANTIFRPSPARAHRIAPTEPWHGKMQTGIVHDPTAYRMDGVAGHAGLFSTADDLAIFAQMLLDEGSGKTVRILQPSTVERMTRSQTPAHATRLRGLGWDLSVPFAPGGGTRAFPRSYGHTGFTGTSLWIDPASKSYVILLTNRVHPHGKGDVRALRTQIARVAASALESTTGVAEERKENLRGRVKTGIEVLAEERFAPLVGLRVGLITNHTGVDSSGRRTLDLLYTAPGVHLAAIFSPEHGLDGKADAKVASGTEAATLLPVHSLYGNVLRPTDAMLNGLDALVFDLQDAGARFYTYITTMAYAMEAAARKGIDFYVLDRPNPIDGVHVQGPILDRDLTSFTGYFPLPVRHGMTVGELARLFNAENKINAKLHLIPMQGYQRTDWYEDTGLPWIAPSPNLRTVTQAALYPGVAIVEGANVSVGRGTATPFEVLGAPWMKDSRLADYLNQRRIPGVRFLPTAFTPTAGRYATRLCYGVRIEVEDRRALDAPALGVELASALYRLYPQHFQLENILGMIGARWVLQALRTGEDPRIIARRWQQPLEKFRTLRSQYLLYAEAPVQ